MVRFLTADYTTFHRAFLDAAHVHLKRYGFSLTRYRILKWVDEKEGLTTTNVANMTEYSVPTVSKELNLLRDQGIVKYNTCKSMHSWTSTEKGHLIYKELNMVVRNVCDSLLAILSDANRRQVESGYYVTVIYLNRVPIDNGAIDSIAACLEVSFEVELIIKKSLQNTNLGLTDFRVILFLHEQKGSTPGDVCKGLLLKKSLVSESLRSLRADGLMNSIPSQFDRRYSLLSLSPEGISLCDAIVDKAQMLLINNIRKTTQSELKAWTNLTTEFVQGYAKGLHLDDK